MAPGHCCGGMFLWVCFEPSWLGLEHAQECLLCGGDLGLFYALCV